MDILLCCWCWIFLDCSHFPRFWLNLFPTNIMPQVVDLLSSKLAFLRFYCQTSLMNPAEDLPQMFQMFQIFVPILAKNDFVINVGPCIALALMKNMIYCPLKGCRSTMQAEWHNFKFIGAKGRSKSFSLESGAMGICQYSLARSRVETKVAGPIWLPSPCLPQNIQGASHSPPTQQLKRGKPWGTSW